MKIKNLDEVVLDALDLFSDYHNKAILKSYSWRHTMIFGSWNAKNTINLMYEDSDCILADENNFKELIKKYNIKRIIIYSASGSKHAVIAAKYSKELDIEIKLVTCTKNNPTTNIIWEKNTLVTSKNIEPYTYNTSTYLWWIISKTNEDPVKIKKLLKEKIDNLEVDFNKYNWYLLAIPNHFAKIWPFLDVKFTELFWRNISRDIKTFEELKHAVTVVPNKKELCISFWDWEFYFQNDKINIDIPDDLWLAWFFCLWYYLVWKIQASNPPYFKENIEEYIKYLNSWDFWKWLEVFV